MATEGYYVNIGAQQLQEPNLAPINMKWANFSISECKYTVKSISTCSLELC